MTHGWRESSPGSVVTFRSPTSPAVLRLTLLVSVLLAAGALAGCGGAPLTAEVDGLRLKEEGGGYPTLTGVVVNTSQEATLRSADVFVTLYDAENRPLESEAFIQVLEDLAPGESARFEKELDVPARAASFRTMILN